MKRKTLVAFVIIMMLGARGYAQELTPTELFGKVEAAYKALDTYKSLGTINSVGEVGGTKVRTETWFSITLKKPDLFLISWSQSNKALPGPSQTGAVWNDGSGPYLYLGFMSAYSAMESAEMALAAATGISGGAAFTIPSLFLSVFGGGIAPFSGLIDPKFEAEEKVGQEDCYVIGASAISKREAFWISKETYLIKKHFRSLEPPEGGMDIPEMTDEDIEAALKGMGQEVSAEAMQNMKKMMEDAKELVANMEIRGSYVETHAIISSPELSESDFTYTLPEGTVLKDSMFGDMLGGARALPDFEKLLGGGSRD